MTAAEIAAFDAVAALTEYPSDESYVARTVASVAELESLGLAAAAPLAKLRDAVCHQSLSALQEEYAAAFDFDPECTLYMGWHLFEDGPDWGPWLAALAGALERVGARRTPELPDHLSQVLMLLAREDDTQAHALADIVLPSLQKIHKRLVERGSPFAALIETAGCLLESSVEEVKVGRD
jgi:nitrate reductase assembly molybdenum cofactor insertion protein NarJ